MTNGLSTARPICIAIVAMGGQGGGVLADWIVALAEAHGWHAQSTSVPGVAQRTGATLYYIEMLPAEAGSTPILSLMPAPGEVDVVLATELMEAGRAILRGLVTPDRTTLIASTHRVYAVSEKEAPGDGIADPSVVTATMATAAKRTIAFDMNALAARSGSVISAPLFGALGGSQALPFAKDAFESVIRGRGKGTEPSLAAFAAGYDQARSPSAEPRPPGKRFDPLPATASHPDLDALVKRVRAEFPEPTQPMLFAGVKRLVDFQDAGYAAEYLDSVREFHALDAPVRAFALSIAAAKYIAIAMAYDDVIAVADRKTRSGRFARVRAEMGVAADGILYATEFMHPRAEEFVGLLPARLGAWIESRPRLFKALDRLVNKGRHVQTGKLGWFLGLYWLAGLRRWRRGTLRHWRERVHRDAWLALAKKHAPANYALAVEIIAARRLVKGYSDTHARGQSKFDRALSALPALAGRADGGDWLRRLIATALKDEDGVMLDGALKTVRQL